ncbi:MAG TPA: MerR family transcriptional regulator [Pseudonocardiaceae bacterium]|nr:MerR family transcriptional regulator [Pseudonocardiaceae bacterium]
MNEQHTWRVGELAEQTGLTVRTLHHYDEIGLLVPSLHNNAGHRRYTADDVRRLHHVIALRGFGFALAEIAELLDEATIDPRTLFSRQLEQVNEQIAAGIRLKHQLQRVLRTIETETEPSSQTMIELIEVMTTVQNPLPPEQFAQLAADRAKFAESLSEEEFAAMAERRRQFAAQLSPEELAEMQRARAALLPVEQAPPAEG